MMVDVVAGTAVEYAVVNTQSPPLDDSRVRAALAHLMPRDRIAELATGRLLVVQSAPLGPEATWWTPALDRAFDPARAAELLEEAGATFDAPLTLVTNATAERTLIAEQIEATFGRHGVRVSSEVVEFRDLLDRAGSGQFDLLVLGIDHGGNPISTVLSAVRGSMTAAPTFSDARVRELADVVARLDPSSDAGAVAFIELLSLLANEATPIYLVATAEVAAVRSGFGEARAHPAAALAFQHLLGVTAP
jgi:peptide/nickel transport system substrate-binding protein